MKSTAFFLKLIAFTLSLSIIVLSVSASDIKGNSNSLKQNSRSGSWRIGGGIGYNFYLGTEMGESIIEKYGKFNTIQMGYGIAAFKSINDRYEIGAFLKSSSLETIKVKSLIAYQSYFYDFKIDLQRSLNDNIQLKNGPFTINAHIGLGVINFQSRFFTLHEDTKTADMLISTVGFDIKNRPSQFIDRAERETALSGVLGLNFGLRIMNGLSIYSENCFNSTSTQRLSGNLFRKSWLPPDCYWYSGVAVYINLGSLNKRTYGRNKCPRFY